MYGMRKSMSGIGQNGNKYYLTTCQNHGNTKGWIRLEGELKPFRNLVDKSKVFRAEFLKSKNVVVKISGDNSIQHEYDVSKRMAKVKGYVRYTCFFTCAGNYFDYPKRNKNYLCNGAGNSLKVIVMPLFPLGTVASHAWPSSESKILRSILKQAVLSYCFAFERMGFVHGDFHAGNIALKETRRELLKYKVSNTEISIPTQGYKSVLMDFENSKFVRTKSAFDLQHFYNDLAKLFSFLPSTVHNIDIRACRQVARYINGLFNDLDAKNIAEIIALIDEITVG